MRRTVSILAAALPLAVQAQNLPCDLSGFKAADGLRASNSGGAIALEWAGENREPLRAAFAIDFRMPVVRELAARTARAPGSFWGGI